ncbi:hypothetical protein LJB91_02350 [Bacteroidales bacterium OttesenSCG-928-L03]|nr:hypothetical protein [Bacteroidales bacterium OttesenSCG-928-L03]
MKKIRSNTLLKLVLLLLYVSFYVGNTAFIHTHYYASYSVTHSHPFDKGTDGNPHHEHDKAALDTIAQFNAFAVDIFFFLALGAITLLLLTISRPYRPGLTFRTIEGYNLRAPPVSPVF